MLYINEIFTGIDGEVNFKGQGALTTFIRFQGCNLNCTYCDTPQARKLTNKKEMSVSQIVDLIPKGKVTITGGEPLLQRETAELIEALLYKKNVVSVETNGSLPFPEIESSDLGWVLDYKLANPDYMCLENHRRLTEKDWIKFVIIDRCDFISSINFIDILKKDACRANYALSPMMNGGKNNALWLAEEMIKYGCKDIVLNIQIHKLIKVDEIKNNLLL